MFSPNWDTPLFAHQVSFTTLLGNGCTIMEQTTLILLKFIIHKHIVFKQTYCEQLQAWFVNGKITVNQATWKILPLKTTSPHLYGTATWK